MPDESGPFPIDGHNVWPAIRDNTPSPRNEIVYQVDVPPYNNVSCAPKDLWGDQSGHLTSCGAALRVDNYKLVLGYGGWPDKVFRLPMNPSEADHEDKINPNNTSEWADLTCHAGCLFDLSVDPAETTNIKTQHPEIFATMKTRLEQVSRQGLPKNNQGGGDPRMCDVVENTGYWLPYQDNDAH
mmetsp:Transcript_16682/g.36179  ORF Transcript_16682/g.36179 Transcript_16682/m.36179 type:complete len:184 (-) Transcript_16682:32-583(-)